MSYTVLTGEADAAMLRRAVEHAIPAACLRDDEAAIREAFENYRRICDEYRLKTPFDRFVARFVWGVSSFYVADLDFGGWRREVREMAKDPWKRGFGLSDGSLLAAGCGVVGEVEGDPVYGPLDRACRDALAALEDGREVFFPADTFRRITNLLKETK